MIQTGVKLKTIIDFLKENLSILIVVPAFIGGLWQALELMNISYSYIRFFSISQIVPDGILILMVFIIILSIHIVIPFIHSLFFEKEKPQTAETLDSINYEKERKRNLNTSIICFVVLYCYILYKIFNPKFDIVNTNGFNDKIITIYFFSTYMVFNLEFCYFYAKEQHKKYYKYCNILLVILYILIVIHFSKPFHKIFTTPENIINIEKVKKDILVKFPKTKQELLYFNDKYIFFKIIDKSKMDKVYIKKIDSLFED